MFYLKKLADGYPGPWTTNDGLTSTVIFQNTLISGTYKGTGQAPLIQSDDHSGVFTTFKNPFYSYPAGPTKVCYSHPVVLNGELFLVAAVSGWLLKWDGLNFNLVAPTYGPPPGYIGIINIRTPPVVYKGTIFFIGLPSTRSQASGSDIFTFNNASPATIVRNGAGSFIAEGFSDALSRQLLNGTHISITSSSSNNKVVKIASVTEKIITLENGQTLTQENSSSSTLVSDLAYLMRWNRTDAWELVAGMDMTYNPVQGRNIFLQLFVHDGALYGSTWNTLYKWNDVDGWIYDRTMPTAVPTEPLVSRHISYNGKLYSMLGRPPNLTVAPRLIEWTSTSTYNTLINGFSTAIQFSAGVWHEGNFYMTTTENLSGYFFHRILKYNGSSVEEIATVPTGTSGYNWRNTFVAAIWGASPGELLVYNGRVVWRGCCSWNTFGGNFATFALYPYEKRSVVCGGNIMKVESNLMSTDGY